MAEMKVTLSNEMLKFMDSGSENFKKAMDTAMKAIVEQYKEECRNIPAPRDTGNLADNHEAIQVGNNYQIVNDTPYWPYPVYGTRYQASQEYRWEVMDKMEPKQEETMKQVAEAFK